MNEQLIAQLQLLIELAKTGEEFELNGFSGKFILSETENQIQILESYRGSKWENTLLTSHHLLNSKIIRKPWKPKVNEDYFYWSLDYWGKPFSSNKTFLNSSVDLSQIAFGNCFRTKQECESHPEVRDKLIAMRKEYE